MKVRMLIDLLKRCDPDDVVIVALDESRGTPLRELSKERYLNGEFGIRELTDIDIDYGLTSDDVMVAGQNCIVLWGTE